MQSDQKEMLDTLDKHHQLHKQVDHILKITLPIIAFLLCVICANYSWQSTLGTFLVLVIAFYSAAIRRINVYFCLIFVAIYCFIDLYLSYSALNISALGRQMGSMLTFTGLIGISRPYLDRWYINAKENQ